MPEILPLPCVLLPETLSAGDSWAFDVAPTGYAPPDGFTDATLYLNGASILALTGAVSTDGTAWTFTATTAETDGLTAGAYRTALRVTDGTDTQTLPGPVLTIAPDFATATAGALLTHEERAIPLLEAAILRRVTVDLAAYTITTRSATKEDLDKMVKLLRSYRAAMLLKKNGGRLASTAVWFGRAG